MEQFNGGKFPLKTMERLLKDRGIENTTPFFIGQYLDREIKDIEGYWFELDNHFFIYNPYDGLCYCAEDADELIDIVLHIKNQYKDYQKDEIERFRMQQETNNLINEGLKDS